MRTEKTAWSFGFETQRLGLGVRPGFQHCSFGLRVVDLDCRVPGIGFTDTSGILACNDCGDHNWSMSTVAQWALLTFIPKLSKALTSNPLALNPI